MKLFVYIAFFILFLYFAIVLFKRLFRYLEQKKLNKVLQSIYNTGRIIHGNSVYTVRDICNCSPCATGKGRLSKYLVVCKLGDTRIFKLPIEDAEPYDGTPAHFKSFLYK